MMIAIVILGLGLVMVATLFPVAWDRARTLSEYTTEQTVASAAHARLASMLLPAGITLEEDPPGSNIEVPKVAFGGLAGDLFFDRALARFFLSFPVSVDEAYQGIIPTFCNGPLPVSYSDTRVHALHMQNILGDANLTDQPEQPWRLEMIQDFSGGVHPCPGYDVSLTADFAGRTSFFAPQVSAAERVHPPLEARPLPSAPQDERDRWNQRMLDRKYSWAVLHRLRTPVGPMAPRRLPTDPLLMDRLSKDLVDQATQAIGSTRNFDMYYFSLRRGQSTHRYARQYSSDPPITPDPNIPNPYRLDRGDSLVSPRAQPALNDVILPVAWRVQVQFLNVTAYRGEAQKPLANQNPALLPTGIPTEIQVPADPAAITGSPAALVVSAFPQGTTFVDEITGAIYRVTKRRVLLSATGNQSAVLTLDREVVLEDVDLPANDPRCDPTQCIPLTDPTHLEADAEELRRTVWVFPPPVDRSAGADDPVFSGGSPVLGVTVQPLSIAPPS